MRTPDGRRGAVFSIRLSDADRELLARACAEERQRRQTMGRPEGEPWEGWYGPVSAGDFIRRAALRAARELLEPGTTKAAAAAKRGKRGRR